MQHHVGGWPAILRLQPSNVLVPLQLATELSCAGAVWAPTAMLHATCCSSLVSPAYFAPDSLLFVVRWGKQHTCVVSWWRPASFSLCVYRMLCGEVAHVHVLVAHSSLVCVRCRMVEGQQAVVCLGAGLASGLFAWPQALLLCTVEACG